MLIAKVVGVKSKGVDLSVKGRGLHKIDSGLIIKVNSNKVPRVIGKQGSMVSIIKQETDCNIVVGQNGIIWIRGENAEQELIAKKAIIFITEKSYTEGLNYNVKEFLQKNKIKK